MNSEQGFTGLKNWLKESVILKLMLIGILTLLLLIPSSMIQDLIWERQERNKEVIAEITDKWSGSQIVEGPVMVLPYKTISNQIDTAGRSVQKQEITNIYLLPDVLDIKGKSSPEILKRGIFKTVVYNSKIAVKGKFSALELKKSGINPEAILWDKAKVIIGLSDLKGLKNNPVIRLGDTSYPVETDFSESGLFKNNLATVADLVNTKTSACGFSFEMDFRGSNELSFLHLGKTTTVNISGNWNNPSFTGHFLPEERNIDNKAFSASWKMPYFNRPFPQQWIEPHASLDTGAKDASFGVKFLLPVDHYQKAMRTAKYSVMIILLTFVSLFFTELLTHRKVHLLQYMLIGAAMVIYYTLLISFTEQVGFDLAYLIASVATVGLISTFIAALLKNRMASLTFGAILSTFYGFVFVIIQMQDLALMFGSIGLFAIVAALMYFSAKIDWNGESDKAQIIPDSNSQTSS